MMDSHELARILLAAPVKSIGASIDIGTEECPDNRIFGSSLSDVIMDSSPEATLIFCEGYDNKNL